jgi:hypothetical protein
VLWEYLQRRLERGLSRPLPLPLDGAILDPVPAQQYVG